MNSTKYKLPFEKDEINEFNLPQIVNLLRNITILARGRNPKVYFARRLVRRRKDQDIAIKKESNLAVLCVY